MLLKVFSLDGVYDPLVLCCFGGTLILVLFPYKLESERARQLSKLKAEQAQQSFLEVKIVIAYP